MAEISREVAKVLLKDHEKWANYSWIDDICEYAISDMQKLEKIEHIVFDIGECNELTETIEEKIEKICNEYNHNCDSCMVSRIKQIVKG